MIRIVLEKHGRVFKVFRYDDSKHDGKNRRLLESFRSSDDAIRFMNNIPRVGGVPTV